MKLKNFTLLNGNSLDLLQFLDCGILILEASGRVQWSNTKAHEFLACTREESLSLNFFHHLKSFDYDLKTEMGDQSYFTFCWSPRQHKHFGSYYKFVIREIPGDILPRYLVEMNDLSGDFKDLLLDLAEQDLKNREVHHRIKNNLQMIQSMICLQKRNVPEPGCQDLFYEIESILNGIAFVHEVLEKPSTQSGCNLRYWEELISGIIRANFPDTSQVKYHLDQQIPQFTSRQTFFLSIILNELIANISKHTQPATGQYQIDIAFCRHPRKNMQYLKITDNGKAFTQPVRKEKEGGTGLRLIQMVLKQIEGKVRRESGPENTVILSFRSTHSQIS